MQTSQLWNESEPDPPALVTCRTKFHWFQTAQPLFSPMGTGSGCGRGAVGDAGALLGLLELHEHRAHSSFFPSFPAQDYVLIPCNLQLEARTGEARTQQ